MLDQIPKGINPAIRIDISSSLLETVNLIATYIMDTTFVTANIVISKNIIVSHNQETDSSSYQVQTKLETTGTNARLLPALHPR